MSGRWDGMGWDGMGGLVGRWVGGWVGGWVGKISKSGRLIGM
jgi:hypothetical protein